MRAKLCDYYRSSMSTSGASTTVLKDFNWEVKVALSSDSVAVVNEPLVLLQLNLAKPSLTSETGESGDQDDHAGSSGAKTGKESRKLLELSKCELDSLLQSLTEASEAISAYAS